MEERDTTKDGISRRVTIDQPSASRSRLETASDPAHAETAADVNTSLSFQIENIDNDLKAIDQAMAEDADALLDGAFESVEEVLGHAVAEESAGERIDSERDGEEPGEVVAGSNQPDEGSGDSSDAQATEPDGGATATVEPPVDQTEPATPEAVEDVSDDASEIIPSREPAVADASVTAVRKNEAIGEAEDGQKPPDDPQTNVDDGVGELKEATKSAADVADAQDQHEDHKPGEPQDQAESSQPEMTHAAGDQVLAEGDDQQSEDTSEAVAEDESVDVREPAAEEEPSPEPPSARQVAEEPSRSESNQAVPAEAQSRLTIKHYGQRFMGRCIAGITAILTILSVPIQFVPPSLRFLVDWLALSLIFWVPIVWVLVLLLS